MSNTAFFAECMDQPIKRLLAILMNVNVWLFGDNLTILLLRIARVVCTNTCINWQNCTYL